MIGNAAAWRDEFTPDTVRAVGQAVVDRFDEIAWAHIGFKGDDNHWGGYHRSLRWCVATRGAGVDYSDRIGRDTSQRSTHRRNAIRGIDVVAPAAILIPMCSRVDWAMRHGLLDDVREWYGNDDGDQRVDGYDNFFDRVVSSDDSHLWHLHLSLYTDTVDAPHTRLIAVLLGTPGWNDMEEEFMARLSETDQWALAWRVQGLAAGLPVVAGGPTRGESIVINQRLIAIEQKVNAVTTAVAAVDEQVADRLRVEFEQIDAANDELRAAVDQVDEAVVEALQADTVEETAALLRAALGDRAAAVGQLLAAQG